MPPNPLAFFSLVPMSESAQAAVDDPHNAHYVSTFLDTENRVMVSRFDIGPNVGSPSRHTLATIGRAGDIVVSGSTLSRIQCSFELSENNQAEIVLHDRSTNKNTQFLGDTAVPFELDRPHRRVVIDPTINLTLGFGGAACDQYAFQIFWHKDAQTQADSHLEYRQDNPRQARTVLEQPQPQTVVPSGPRTRIHAPRNDLKIRYSKRGKLGEGSFGEVFKVVDVDTGKYLAVKQVKEASLESSNYLSIKREVETLSRLCHVSLPAPRAGCRFR